MTRVIRSRIPPSLDVEDVLQEVSLAVLKSENPPQGDDECRRWVCRIAMTQCALAMRRFTRKQSLKETARNNGMNTFEVSDPVSWLIAHEEHSQIETAMSNIDEESRQLVWWKIVEKLTYAEIASRLNLSPDAVEYRVLKARQILRAELIDLGSTREDEQ